MSAHPLEELLHPRSIAVVGASGNPESSGHQFTDALVQHGFRGPIYPVNPKYTEILGFKAYARVIDIPGPVDYVISNVPAPQVPAMLEDCGQKGVKVVHLFTARFSETGRQAAIELEREVLRLAKKNNIRLIGPNCMGLYYPKEGIAFSDSMSKNAGPVGLISQSGQMVGEITRMAAQRGVYFSKAISYGNALDLNECDFLEYLAQDVDTSVILMYVEGLRDGRRFVELLRQTTPHKPVVILKGGRGQAGARATASHTASLAGSAQMWRTALAQVGAVSAVSPEELVDLAVSFRFLPPIEGLRVGVAGGAGGASVIAADACEEAGLDVVPLSEEFRAELKRKGVSIWDWIGNPADMSITENRDFTTGDMVEMMASCNDFDLLILLVGEPWRRRPEMTAAEHLKQFKLEARRSKPILTVVAERDPNVESEEDWSWDIMREVRKQLLEDGIPFYRNIGRAARAARKLVGYYQKRASLATAASR